MIISEKQLQMLLQTLRDTLGIHSQEFTFHNSLRVKLYEKILGQQSEELAVKAIYIEDDKK